MDTKQMESHRQTQGEKIDKAVAALKKKHGDGPLQVDAREFFKAMNG